MFQEKIMKNKIYRFVIFQLLLFGLFKICHAYVGIGISDVGTLGSSTGIEIDNITPDGYRLYQNYPNPFNPVTTITFSIEQTGIVSLISIIFLFSRFHHLQEGLHAGADLP